MLLPDSSLLLFDNSCDLFCFIGRTRWYCVSVEHRFGITLQGIQAGRPNLLYHWPWLYGTQDYLCEVRDDVIECKRTGYSGIPFLVIMTSTNFLSCCWEKSELNSHAMSTMVFTYIRYLGTPWINMEDTWRELPRYNCARMWGYLICDTVKYNTCPSFPRTMYHCRYQWFG